MGLKALFSGNFSEQKRTVGEPLELRSGQEAMLIRRLMTNVDVVASEYTTLTPEAAFGWLQLGEAGPAANMVGGSGPRRGDVIAMDVDALALPSCALEGVRLMEVSERCASLLRDRDALFVPGALTEKFSEEVRKEKLRYVDPCLKKKEELLRLGARLWKAGMLRHADRAVSYVGMFSVVKKNDHGTITQRLVLDQREGNKYWKKPPWTALGGIGALSGVDLSSFVEDMDGGLDPSGAPLGAQLLEKKGLRMRISQGDVPDYYYHLALPEKFEELFVVEHLLGEDLTAYFSGTGENIVVPPGLLGLGVVAMGWSWGVFLAQTALQDITNKDESRISSKNALIDGAASPSLEETDGTVPVVHSVYVDDFSTLGLANEYTDPVRAAYEEGAARIKSCGLSVHKEAHGGETTFVGCRIGPGPVVRPLPEKVSLLIRASTFLRSRRHASRRTLQEVVGLFSWFFAVQRCGYAVFAQIYELTSGEDLKEVLNLPESVTDELRVAEQILPLITLDLCAPWVKTITQTDASEEGGAAVVAEANTRLLREESRWALRGGWTVFTGQPEEIARRQITLFPADDVLERARASLRQAMTVARSPTIRVWRVLHLFSGHPRTGDLGEAWVVAGEKFGTYVECVNIDVGICRDFDLTDDNLVDRLLSMIRSGAIQAIHGGPPCSTWSAARLHGGGPGPLRSRDQPWGISSLTEKDDKKVQSANKMMFAFWILAEEMIKRGLPFTMEHPKDGGRAASFWATDFFLNRKKQHQLVTVDLCQCAFGCPHRKPTTIVGNFGGIKDLSRPCCGRDHTPLLGKDDHGEFLTKATQAYPADLCSCLSQVTAERLDYLGHGSKEEWPLDSKLEDASMGEKLPVPPVASHWDDLRWRLLFKTRWRLEEHINVLEARTVALTVTRMCTSTETWGRRIQIQVDSQVTLAALSKGRSSRKPLNHIARRVASQVLAFGLKLILRWVPTKRNQADGPSRGQGVGPANLSDSPGPASGLPTSFKHLQG